MENEYDLAKWLAGEMSDAELATFRKSPAFMAYARIAEVSAKFEAPAFDSTAMYQNIVDSKPSTVKVVPLFSQTWFRVASIIVVFVGLAFFMKSYITKTITSENGQTSMWSLPDNSQVTLNAGSEICYKKLNWENDRVITLEGEAYFKVAKGKKFVVSTNLGKVSVLGTQFDVKARNERFDVSCYEGRVKVDYDSQSVIITKGQHVAFENGKALEISGSNATAPEWINDEVAFQQEKLLNIVAELNRQYDIEINVKGTADQLFTGTLPLNNLGEALQILTSTYHLKTINENGRIILVAVNGHP